MQSMRFREDAAAFSDLYSSFIPNLVGKKIKMPAQSVALEYKTTPLVIVLKASSHKRSQEERRANVPPLFRKDSPSWVLRDLSARMGLPLLKPAYSVMRKSDGIQPSRVLSRWMNAASVLTGEGTLITPRCFLSLRIPQHPSKLLSESGDISAMGAYNRSCVCNKTEYCHNVYSVDMFRVLHRHV